MGRIFGREKLLDQVEAYALRGRTVIVHGPLGIGKTTILDELSRRIATRGLPCGKASITRYIGDVAAGLSSAYLGMAEQETGSRRARSRLRMGVESRPGVLLLDHFTTAGTATKGFLRSLRGTGLGVVLAADTENERDHTEMRAQHLTYLEIRVPPLAGRSMTALFGDLARRRKQVHQLVEDDLKILLKMAQGNPGHLVAFVDLLAETRFWQGDRVRTAAVYDEVRDSVLKHYLAMNADR